MRIQQLENRLRQITGQNEELQYRNRQLEEQLRQQGGRGAGPPPAAERQLPPRRQRDAAAAAPPIQAVSGLSAIRHSRQVMAADRRAGADRAGAAPPPRGRAAPWRCLRSQPESECARRAARARRRSVCQLPADERRPVGAPAGAAQANRSICRPRRVRRRPPRGRVAAAAAAPRARARR